MSEIREVPKDVGTNTNKKVEPLLPPKVEKVRKNELHKIQKKTNDPSELYTIERFNTGIDSPTGNNDFQLKEELAEKLPTYDTKISPKVREELSTTKRIIDPDTKQVFGMVIANRENLIPKVKGEVTLSLQLYGNERTQRKGFKTLNNEALERDARLADTMPNIPLIGLEYPSIGASDRIRPDQLSTDPKYSYFAIADAQLRALKRIGVTKINVVGNSMGAFAGLALAVRAAEHGIEVGNLLLFESPGVKEMPAGELMKRDIKEVTEYLDINTAFPLDPEMIASSHLGQDRSLMDQLKYTASLPVKDAWFVYARAMARKTVPSRVQQVIDSQAALRTTPGHEKATLPKIVFINGTESTVSSEDDVNAIVADFAERGYKDQVTKLLFPGGSHVSFISPKRQADIASWFINGSFLPAPETQSPTQEAA